MGIEKNEEYNKTIISLDYWNIMDKLSSPIDQTDNQIIEKTNYYIDVLIYLYELKKDSIIAFYNENHKLKKEERKKDLKTGDIIKNLNLLKGLVINYGYDREETNEYNKKLKEIRYCSSFQKTYNKFKKELLLIEKEKIKQEQERLTQEQKTVQTVELDDTSKKPYEIVQITLFPVDDPEKDSPRIKKLSKSKK